LDVNVRADPLRFGALLAEVVKAGFELLFLLAGLVDVGI